MRTFLRQNSLSLFFGVIFLAALVGQAFTGHAEYNAQQISAGLATVSLGRYLTSSSFAVDVAENWQSEYLQFLLYILATVWMLQRGSPESKALDDAGTETDEEQRIGPFASEHSPAPARRGGAATWWYSQSLGLAMGAIFIASWAAQSLAGVVAYDEERIAQLQKPVSWAEYVTGSDFWNRTLQNWQSEFLAVGSMAVFSIYLRQRGSSQSKPVGAPHSATDIES
jgi:hypothetical protein